MNKTVTRAFLERRWQSFGLLQKGLKADGGAKDGTTGTAERRERRTLRVWLGRPGADAPGTNAPPATPPSPGEPHLPPAAPGGGEAGLRPAGAAAVQGRAGALDRVKEGYSTGARRLASRSIVGLAQTRVSPNALTAGGVLLCAAGSVLVYFEYRHELLFFWLGAATFVLGSILDILDGALARVGGKSTPFGAFIDSTTDRVGEGFMLGAIALVFARDGHEVALALTFAALAGSFLVSYTRARAEALGLRGDVGIGSRAERVVVITAGLVVAPWGVLPWAIYLLTATAWITVAQRVLHVRTQLLRRKEADGFGRR